MAALLVFLDQLTKFLAVVNLKNPGKVVEIIPNVFEFRYLENQSAAFGIDLLSIIQRIFKFSYWTNNPRMCPLKKIKCLENYSDRYIKEE